MRRKTLRANDLAKELCRQVGFSYERIHYLAEALLCRYAEGQAKALIDPADETAELITKKKQEIRRRYLEIMSGIREFTEEEYSRFVWDVVRSRWFSEKADMVLGRIEEMIDGSITDSPYDPERDVKKEGKQLKTIIHDAYLNGKNKVKTPVEIYTAMEISKATYNRRLPDGVVLFGIVMWIYANRREKEDIDAGLVEMPEYYREVACI